MKKAYHFHPLFLAENIATKPQRDTLFKPHSIKNTAIASFYFAIERCQKYTFATLVPTAQSTTKKPSSSLIPCCKYNTFDH